MTQEKIKTLLANFLGVDKEDINDDDSLKEDLHMSPSDIVDFSQVLKENGAPLAEEDLEEIELVSDLYEKLI